MLYPGRMRPGLIEAVIDDLINDADVRGIRGACAPASLKPERIYGLTICSCLYPGRMRPGLIEARVNLRVREGIHARYPGRMRPGLIEADAKNSEQERQVPCIRGACAPASLKRSNQ